MSLISQKIFAICCNIVVFILINSLYIIEKKTNQNKIKLFFAVTVTSLTVSIFCNLVLMYFVEKSAIYTVFTWYCIVTVSIWLNILTWKTFTSKDCDYEEGDEDEEDDYDV